MRGGGRLCAAARASPLGATWRARTRRASLAKSSGSVGGRDGERLREPANRRAQMREQQPVPYALCPSAPALYPLPLPLLCPLHLRRLAGPPSALLAAPSASPLSLSHFVARVLVLPAVLALLHAAAVPAVLAPLPPLPPSPTPRSARTCRHARR